MSINAAAPPATDTTFEDVVVPHLGVALRLARRLVRNENDAEDVVQEACLRAHRYFSTFSGGNGRAWFFKIVRNTCWGWYSRASHPTSDTFDEERHGRDCPARDPESLALQADETRLITMAMAHLPDRCRRLLQLRELEGLSYRELADVMDLPVGTVMSRLSRSRRAVRKALDDVTRLVPKRAAQNRDAR